MWTAACQARRADGSATASTLATTGSGSEAGGSAATAMVVFCFSKSFTATVSAYSSFISSTSTYLGTFSEAVAAVPIGPHHGHSRRSATSAEVPTRASPTTQPIVASVQSAGASHSAAEASTPTSFAHGHRRCQVRVRLLRCSHGR